MKSVKLTKYNETLQLVDEALPTLKGTECLIRMTSSGLCHSDLHILEGHFDLGGGEKIDMSSKLPLPVTLGHEAAGVVCQLGPDLNPEDPENKELLGKKVIVYPWHQGQGVQRPGGFSTHIVAQKSDLVPSEGIPEEQTGPLACSGLTSYSALKKAARALQGAGVAKRRVLIIGAGGVGLQAVSLARSVLKGQSPIVADIDDTKLELAQKLFAETATGEDGDADLTLETVNSRQLPEAVKRVLELTEGKGPDVVLDFVGSTATVALGIKTLGVRLHRGWFDGGNSNGRLILVGLFGGSFPLPLPLIPLQNLTIEGSYVGSLSELKELVALRKKFPLTNFPVALTEFSEQNVNDSVQKLRGGKVVGRVVFTYSHL